MSTSFFTPFALLGIAANVSLSLAWLGALVGPYTPWPLLRPLRHGCLKPLALAVLLHWFFYFGPINIGALLLSSNIQETYNWVIRRPLIASAAFHSLVSYGLILSLLAGVALLLQAIGLNERLLLVPRWPRYQLLLVCALLFLISVLIAPVIGTTGADRGGWVKDLPILLRPWGKGVFLMEAIPLIAAGWQIIAASAPPPRQDRWFFFLVSGLQLVTFILLRQRFLSLLAVGWLVVCLFRWWRQPLLWCSLLFGLLLAYSIPTALRYTRVARAPGQPLESYLYQSWQNFSTGMIPANLVASAINDFSYNKAGMASLSVVLDLRRSALLGASDAWAWIQPEVYRAMPGVIKEKFSEFGLNGAEPLVTKALKVGIEGWSNPGVSQELAKGWVVDLMETPLLGPVATGGWLGLICFSVVSVLILALSWLGFCCVQNKFPAAWILPLGVLAIVSLGASWLGELLVLIKLSLPWLSLCFAASWMYRIFRRSTICW